ncbi:PREDICTED: ELMO domain-containing protein C isoform X1 [Theobroma cacao]|uniref:ELMO domain-containing protein C isoform X1 n=1 Tax=Theobroma cacao TaxID=3641 RepID=A0AB32VXK4_THECC|nr:PREDICTED: ELMO domain-containing protein C isoform X1 [Theobroma cacao]
MSVVRTQGSCVAIRSLSPSSSINRCSHGSATSGCEPVIVNLDGYVKTKKSLQWLYADAATCGTPAWIGKGLTCVCFKRKGAYERICINLTPLQEERLKRLKHRMKVYFDGSRPDHQEALRALWSATYPGQELQGLISDQWKEMGWQGRDPSTDFRGAGFISLENLLFFAKTFSTSFQRLLKKQGGKRAAWEYPFAVAGVNITFMIMQMLDLDASKPRTFIRSVFLQMLSENEWAFDLLYCVAFMVMDKQWLERNATYMEFNDVLKSTRAQLERELLMDDVLRIEDMPSYSLLC